MKIFFFIVHSSEPVIIDFKSYSDLTNATSSDRSLNWYTQISEDLSEHHSESKFFLVANPSFSSASNITYNISLQRQNCEFFDHKFNNFEADIKSKEFAITCSKTFNSRGTIKLKTVPLKLLSLQSEYEKQRSIFLSDSQNIRALLAGSDAVSGLKNNLISLI